MYYFDTLEFKIKTRYLIPIVVLLMVYVFFWNLRTFKDAKISMSPKLNFIARIFRIDQKWSMFAPKPFSYDGWFVIQGELNSGEIVDVFREGTDFSWEKPMHQYSDYKTYRWRKYMRNLIRRSKEKDRIYYLHYLCNTWNNGNNNSEKLKHIKMYYVKDYKESGLDEEDKIRKLEETDCAGKIKAKIILNF